MSRPHLSRRLVLESPETVPDGAGGISKSWVELGMLWAQVTSRSGRERGQAGLPVSQVSYKIVVRGAPHGSEARPRPDQRFREGARVFAIRAVAEYDGAGRYLVCFADEEMAA